MRAASFSFLSKCPALNPHPSKLMKTLPLFAFFALLAFSVVGCTPTQRSAATGAAAGAALGTIIADGDDHKKGALIGAGVGAAAGVAAQKHQEKKRNPYYY